MGGDGHSWRWGLCFVPWIPLSAPRPSGLYIKCSKIGWLHLVNYRFTLIALNGISHVSTISFSTTEISLVLTELQELAHTNTLCLASFYPPHVSHTLRGIMSQIIFISMSEPNIFWLYKVETHSNKLTKENQYLIKSYGMGDFTQRRVVVQLRLAECIIRTRVPLIC